ncbi:Na(+)-translocating NADH-quinone reductase subunit F [Abyssalbus ytuae]|uniref:Na(+)-translocating NADH-quinone reductase subunit F n=1 Tax=Abyssalbus ytuae TaxID=2926907 RepID=A0A9E6ZNG1_9FLAO|nr:Na(+)-translocating NADH-quinone reductase subunit F [Abyssalbus ytuae]UOB17585.1 Na(+)-translocating NADH-quinone reductase subunit F [Abyssalbus ytuae]
MKLSKRLDSALNKLYIAFNNDMLNPECCKQCAVGNICNNTDFWKNFTEVHGSVVLNYLGTLHERLGRTYYGYSPKELLQIEAVFLKGCGYELPYKHGNKKPQHPTSKDILFNGLNYVVKYLCELDGVPDVMDTRKLFNYIPEKESEEVLSSHSF